MKNLGIATIEGEMIYSVVYVSKRSVVQLVLGCSNDTSLYLSAIWSRGMKEILLWLILCDWSVNEFVVVVGLVLRFDQMNL